MRGISGMFPIFRQRMVADRKEIRKYTGGAALYDLETEYRRIFETPLEEIKEDIFFRADNFKNEAWYGDLQMYLAIGVCKPDRGSLPDLQKALKVLGYPTQTSEIDEELFLIPHRERQTQPNHKQKMER